VRLAPFSKDILREVFMRIEEPEIPINPFFSPEDPDPGEDHITIGDFYQGIKEHIRRLGNEIFRGDPSRQLRTGFCELQSLDIRSVDSASDAIDLIVTQGEGTKQSPFDSETELAHYYRFAEIYVGRKLVRDYDPPPGAPKFHYVGHAIPFNPSGVWPVVSDPSAFLYRRCPLLADLNRSFNGTYTRLLQTLQRVFNGEPDWLSVGFTVMGSLEKQARAMMAMEIVPGLNAGPTFEYLE